MRILDAYGSPVARYEGTGTLYRFPGENSQSLECSFEAIQLVDGAILLAGRLSQPVTFREVDRFEGHSIDPVAEIVATSLLLADSRSSPGVGTWLAYAGRLAATTFFLREEPMEVVFDLTNFVFGGAKHSIHLEQPPYQADISPQDDYDSAIETLRAAKGQKITATLRISSIDGRGLNLPGVEDLADEICVVASLATGTKATWLNYRVPNSNAPLAYAHRDSVTKPFSNKLDLLGWRPDLDAILTDWAAANRPAEARKYDKRMIDYFLDGVSATQFLETNGLALAALIDATTAHHARETGVESIVPVDEWKSRKADLKGAIASVFEPESAARLARNLEGLNRRPFRENLEDLFDSLSLPKPDLRLLLAIRNSLVHDAAFPDGIRPRDAYRVLLWSTFAILARTVGFTGQLEDPPEVT